MMATEFSERSQVNSDNYLFPGEDKGIADFFGVSPFIKVVFY